MNLTRRQFNKFAFAAVPALGTLGSLASPPSLRAAPMIDSNIHGVQFGLQPFCYHDLPMNIANRPLLFQRMVQNGLGVVELHATWVEPRFTDPSLTADQARDKIRQWRLNTPASYYEAIRKEAEGYGISIFAYWTGFNDSHTDAEIDAIFEGAKALGAKGVTGSYGLAVAHRVAAFPAKHGIFMGLHNHDNLSDPDAFSTEQTFITGLSYSPDIKATLDVRHFTAANGDCIGFLERHHERTSSIHLGDRRRNNGQSMPFGQGDAPIIEILRLIRDNKWPIVALLEFEHGTLLDGVQEVQICFDYCKRALE